MVSYLKGRTHHGLESKVYFESPTLCLLPVLATVMDGLDDEQRRAVHQLQEISNTTDDDVAVGVLSSVDWDIQVNSFDTLVISVLTAGFLNIQKATELIFGSAPIPSSSRVSEMQTFDIDDSHQGELGRLPDAQPRQRVMC